MDIYDPHKAGIKVDTICVKTWSKSWIYETLGPHSCYVQNWVRKYFLDNKNKENNK